MLNKLGRAFAICAGLSVSPLYADNDSCHLPRNTGIATWYKSRSPSDITATGDRFTGRDMTAASRILKFGSEVIVTNLENGESTKVTINDNGPYTDAIIDLSERVAEELDFIDDGRTRVRLEVLSCR